MTLTLSFNKFTLIHLLEGRGDLRRPQVLFWGSGKIQLCGSGPGVLGSHQGPLSSAGGNTWQNYFKKTCGIDN